MIILQGICLTRQASPGLIEKLEPFGHFPRSIRQEVKRLLKENGWIVETAACDRIQPDTIIDISSSDGKLVFFREWSLRYLKDVPDALMTVFEFVISQRSKPPHYRDVIHPDIKEIISVPGHQFPIGEFEIKHKFDSDLGAWSIFCLPEEVASLRRMLKQNINQRLAKSVKMAVAPKTRHRK